MDAVEIRFVWSEEHYARAMRVYGRTWTMRLLTLFVWAFVAFLLYMAWKYANPHDGTIADTWPYVVFYIVLAAIMLTVRGPFSAIRNRRRFRVRPDQAKPIRYEIREDGMTAETEGLAKSELQWGMFIKALVAPDTLLLFLTPRQYQYIPLDGIEASARDRLLSLVESKVGKVQLV